MNRIALREQVLGENHSVKTSADWDNQMNVEATARAQAAHHIGNMDRYTATCRFNDERHPQRRRPQLSANRRCTHKIAGIHRP
jgi:hypothetical protein